ncbi:MAG: hypothetical protein WDO69_35505 [Pseudomonadota bacterium]
MTTRPFFEILAGATLLALTACNGETAVRPLSPHAERVRVESGDPPAGATPLGPIEVSDGDRCSLTGDRGTLAGATALLKESALHRGANFVKVTKVTEPYAGHDCYHREFKIEGLSYRLADAPIVATAAPAAPPEPPAAVCTPICSPGYACEAGVCRALCNPACGADQVCRVDRVCVPASAAP